MMKINKSSYIWVSLIILFFGSIIFYFFLPDKIPMQWQFNGDVSRYGNKEEIFILPFIAIIISLAMKVIPKIDPKRSNYIFFEGTYNDIITLIIIFLTLIQAIIIYKSFFPQDFKIDLVMPIILGALFIVLGKKLPVIRHNYFMGIRTPWTLADENVWEKTHKFGGKVWVCGGIFMILSSFLPAEYKMVIFFVIIFVIIFVIVLIPAVYSYLKYRSVSDK